MKKLCALLIGISLMCSITAFASCNDAYYDLMLKTEQRNDKVVETTTIAVLTTLVAAAASGITAIVASENGYEDLADTSAGIYGVSLGIGIVAIGVGIGFTKARAEAYLILSIARSAGADSSYGGERKTLQKLNRLLEKVQMKNKEASMNDVLDEVKIGFDEEIFCQDEVPYNWRRIERHVIDQLSLDN